MSVSFRLVHVFFSWIIHHVLSPAVVTLSCNYLIFMRICLSCTSAVLVLCTLRLSLTPCPWLKELHVIIQARDRRDWPTGPTAQWDLFDFTPLSVVAVIFTQQGSLWEKKMNTLINFRHLLASQRTNAPKAIWRILFIISLSELCKHTVSI